MTSNRAKFTTFKPCCSTVEAANKEVMEVVGRGQVKIELSKDCGGTVVELQDVLYVPSLDGNLLSVGKIEERGLSVTFSNGKAKVIEANGDLIVVAKRDGKLYTESKSLATLKLAKATDVALWHRRLGHLHHEAVEKLCQSGRSSQDAKCSTCALGKLKKSSFRRRVEQRLRPHWSWFTRM